MYISSVQWGCDLKRQFIEHVCNITNNLVANTKLHTETQAQLCVSCSTGSESPVWSIMNLLINVRAQFRLVTSGTAFIQFFLFVFFLIGHLVHYLTPRPHKMIKHLPPTSFKKNRWLRRAKMRDKTTQSSRFWLCHLVTDKSGPADQRQMSSSRCLITELVQYMEYQSEKATAQNH